MREILFRGKPLANPKLPFIYGSLLVFNDCYSIKENKSFAFEKPINSKTLGEFTGVYDKNGVKVFEGDIFKFDDEVWASYYTPCGTEYNSWDVVNYAAIGFDSYYCRYDFVKYKFDENSIAADLHENHDIELADFISELEVVGNIYDNPELLEV